MAFLAKEGTRYNPAFLCYRTMFDSLTFSVGEAVESLSSGYAKKATAATPFLGIIVGFTDSSKAPLASDAVTKSTTAYAGSVESVTTAADNTTVAMKQAIVCFDPSVIWSAQVNGTINTTASSSLPSVGIDVDSAGSNYGRLLETTATRTAATKTSFMCFGADPDDSTRLLASINCSEVFSSAKG